MIVTGLRKPENEEANEEDKLNVISAAAKEAEIDKNDFKKCFDKIHPMGGYKKRKPSESNKVYYTQLQGEAISAA